MIAAIHHHTGTLAALAVVAILILSVGGLYVWDYWMRIQRRPPAPGPAGVIQVDGPLSSAQAAKLRADWDRLYTGTPSGVAIADMAASFKRLNETAQTTSQAVKTWGAAFKAIHERTADQWPPDWVGRTPLVIINGRIFYRTSNQGGEHDA